MIILINASSTFSVSLSNKLPLWGHRGVHNQSSGRSPPLRRVVHSRKPALAQYHPCRTVTWGLPWRTRHVGWSAKWRGRAESGRTDSTRSQSGDRGRSPQKKTWHLTLCFPEQGRREGTPAGRAWGGEDRGHCSWTSWPKCHLGRSLAVLPSTRLSALRWCGFLLCKNRANNRTYFSGVAVRIQYINTCQVFTTLLHTVHVLCKEIH